MNGAYLEMQIRGYIIGPIIAFREYIFSDVLPAFGDLNERADKVAQEYYDTIGSQPAGEDWDIDMGDVAEDAQDRGLSWYQMMTSLRQSMLNLLTAGLFHLTEQRLALVCRDGGFMMEPPRGGPLRTTPITPPAERRSIRLRHINRHRRSMQLRKATRALTTAPTAATDRVRRIWRVKGAESVSVPVHQAS